MKTFGLWRTIFSSRLIWLNLMMLDKIAMIIIIRYAMETGDRSKCDPETLCFQAYHVIC